jgi:hypothetical protein
MSVGTLGFASQPLGYQRYTSLSSATNLSSIPTRATMAVITVKGTAGIRWRDDGTNPTASVGTPVAAGATFSYTGKLSALSIIEEAASASVNVTYYA